MNSHDPNHPAPNPPAHDVRSEIDRIQHLALLVGAARWACACSSRW